MKHETARGITRFTAMLCADYPDPDIIRVAGDFYMMSTTFIKRGNKK
jgi:beta-xylosidase